MIAEKTILVYHKPMNKLNKFIKLDKDKLKRQSNIMLFTQSIVQIVIPHIICKTNKAEIKN